MTRITNKIINWFTSTKRDKQTPDHVFWQSLLAIQWRFYEEVLLDYVRTGRSSEHIYNQFSTIDCWLDHAIENGWMDKNDPNE